MKIRLNRIRIMFIGLLIISTFLIINRMVIINECEFTKGTVKKIVVNHSPGNGAISSITPLIDFIYKGQTITFEATANINLEMGENVDVIYKKDNPANAEVFSFVGFWLIPIIYCLLPILFLLTATYSFLAANNFLVVDLGTFFKKKIN